LGAKLQRSEKITKLTLTSDYYGNARQPRLRNQQQISVKIEGVRNGDPPPPKMTPEIQPGSPGLYAIQISPEWELLHIEPVQKGTFRLDAAEMEAKPVLIERAAHRYKLALASASFEAIDHHK